VGDRVQISKTKRTFEKGYLPNWTTELFTISRKVPRCNAHRIDDNHGEELEGTFYAKEIQVYEVEEVLAYKIIPEVKVRWKGYPASFDS
jgi:hypothetical protein